MTAEIAIMNRSAIAVAADSAVTRGPNKVHVNANKIFRLSDQAPIGLMVYGNADVFGLPWELIAKLYRTELGSKTFDTVSEWSENFISFLHDDRFLDADIAQREIAAIAYYLSSKIKDNCYSFQKRTMCKEISTQFDALIDLISSSDALDGYLSPPPISFARLYGAICKDVFSEVFDKAYLTNHIVKRFPEIVRSFASSKQITDYMSGFIIFGFGNKEIMPRLFHHIVDCAPYARPRLIKGKERSIGRVPLPASSIFSFAHSDTANMFMEEVSLRTKRFFMRSVDNALNGFGAKMFDEFEMAGKIVGDEKKVYSHLFKQRVEEFSKNFQKSFDKHIRQYSIDPILVALDGLGKEDMANLAEALVELTALKLKVSGKTEVVGGPIDIAVLSKIDGFIWIKRKHYFEPEYNPHFFKNYGKIKGTHAERLQ